MESDATNVKRLINRKFFLNAITAFVYKVQMMFDTTVNIAHSGDKRYFEDMLKHLGSDPVKQSTESTGEIEMRFAGMSTDASQNTAPTSINIYLPTDSGEVGKFVVDNARRRTINIPVECRFLTTDIIDSLDRTERLINELTHARHFVFEWLGLQCGGTITQDESPEVLPGRQSAIELPDIDNNGFLPFNMNIELQFYSFSLDDAKYLMDHVLKYWKLSVTASAHDTPKTTVRFSG